MGGLCVLISWPSSTDWSLQIHLCICISSVENHQLVVAMLVHLHHYATVTTLPCAMSVITMCQHNILFNFGHYTLILSPQVLWTSLHFQDISHTTHDPHKSHVIMIRLSAKLFCFWFNILYYWGLLIAGFPSSFKQMTLSATATAYVTGHDRSHTSKMTGQGVVCPITDLSFY